MRNNSSYKPKIRTSVFTLEFPKSVHQINDIIQSSKELNPNQEISESEKEKEKEKETQIEKISLKVNSPYMREACKHLGYTIEDVKKKFYYSN